MNKILEQYDKIFIDTSTFLIDKENIFDSKNNYVKKILSVESNQFIQKVFFIDTLLPILKNINHKINVPFEVIEEIKKKEKIIKTRTSNALKILNLLKRANSDNSKDISVIKRK